eukprot:4529666-Ditylum_brightwellii.AAC.1
MERSKQNKHVVGDKDDGVGNNVDNSVDDGVDKGVNNSVNDSDDGANKHLTHLSQVADCHLMERSERNVHVV